MAEAVCPGPTVPDDQFGGPEPDDAHFTGIILRLNDDGSRNALKQQVQYDAMFLVQDGRLYTPPVAEPIGSSVTSRLSLRSRLTRDSGSNPVLSLTLDHPRRARLRL